MEQKEYWMDIIIPQYNESPHMLNFLLTSINNQIGLKLECIRVTIVNDHNLETAPLIEEYLKNTKFDFDVQFLMTPENCGPGQCRQYGLDHTSAATFMFIDADDRLYSNDALYSVLNAIAKLEAKHTPWALIWTYFFEEYVSGQYALIKHNNRNNIWLHGKVYNRQVVQQYGIRFHKTLRTHEDTYFGRVLTLCVPENMTFGCDHYTYLWLRNSASITSNWNHDGRSYVYWHYKDSMECQYSTLRDTMDKALSNELWMAACVGSLLHIFFTHFAEGWQDLDNSETALRIKYLDDTFVRICSDFNDKIQLVPAQQFINLYNQCRTTFTQNFVLFPERFGWNEYVEDLKKRYPEHAAALNKWIY